MAAKPRFNSASYPISWSNWQNKTLMIRLYLHGTVNATDPTESEIFSVAQNYPNPFNGYTAISYSLGQKADVRLEITDLTGWVVFRKEEGQQMIGNHRMTIENPGLSPGIYFYTLFAGTNRETKKMVVLEGMR
jgi:hypothetical protein